MEAGNTLEFFKLQADLLCHKNLNYVTSFIEGELKITL
jgi:hypothetical protein